MKIKLLTLLFFSFSSAILSQENSKIESLKKKLQIETIDTTKVSIHLKIANLFLKSNKDSSFLYYNKALDLAKKVNVKPLIANSLYEMGVYYKNNNDYGQAIRSYKEAASIFNGTKQAIKEAKTYNELAFCYSSIFNENKAIEYYVKSLSLYKIENDEKGIAINYNGIGNLYYSQGNYEYAKKYFEDALTIYKKLDNQQGIENLYLNIGNVIAESGDNLDGIKYYEKALVFLKRDNDVRGIAAVYNNIGDSYLSMKRYEKANTFFLKSLKTAEKEEDKELMAIIYLNMAEIHLNLKEYKEVILNAKLSLKIAKEIGALNIEEEDLKFLSKAFEQSGNISQAYYYIKQYKEISEFLANNEKNKNTHLFQALNNLEKTQNTIDQLAIKTELTELKYESAKKFSYFLMGAIVLFILFLVLLIFQRASKKKAYNLLSDKNNQISKMNDEIQIQRDYLKKVNKAKDTLFSIIAHDLKNPFNSINGFTELLIENIHKYDEEKRLKFLKIIKGSVVKASSLLDNLLAWASSQSGDIDFHSEETELIQKVSNVISLLEIQAMNKEITLLNKITHQIFVDADKNMLATILRNLISNAIKFTESNGKVEISSIINADFIEITVKDNGVGIAASDVKNLFNIDVKNSNVGTANEQGSGLGLVLCKDFVEKHGGRLWVESSLNKGSEFKFTLPIAV